MPVQIQRRKHGLDHIDHTDHTDHTDQESYLSAIPGRSIDHELWELIICLVRPKTSCFLYALHQRTQLTQIISTSAGS